MTRSFEPGWPGKAAGVHRAVFPSGLSPSVPTHPMPLPNSHQKVEKKKSGCFSLSIALCFNKQFAVTLSVGIEFELDRKEVRWRPRGSLGCRGFSRDVSGSFLSLHQDVWLRGRSFVKCRWAFSTGSSSLKGK